MVGKLKVIKRTKEATVCENKNGERVVLYTPSGKVKKYGREIKKGVNSTTGEVLTDAQVGYRIGYRAALGEQAKIYNRSKRKR